MRRGRTDHLAVHPRVVTRSGSCSCGQVQVGRRPAGRRTQANSVSTLGRGGNDLLLYFGLPGADVIAY